MTFSGRRTYDQILDKVANKFVDSDSPMGMGNKTANYRDDLNQSVLSDPHFAGDEYLDFLTHKEERAERIHKVEVSTQNAREDRNFQWQMKALKREEDMFKSPEPQPIQAEPSIPQPLTIEQQAIQQYLDAMHGIPNPSAYLPGRVYFPPMLAPNHSSNAQIPSEIQLDPTWLSNNLNLEEKKALFLKEWNDLPSNYKSDLVVHPEHFQNYFPNFSDTLNTISNHSDSDFMQDFSRHLQTDSAHFSDYFLSEMNEFPL